jgi:hypothetical protein
VSIPDRLDAVRERIDAGCRAAGRDPSEVGLIAVSKTHPLDAIETAAIASHLDFGESYAQELRDKSRARPDLRWHFIGRVQTNKAKYIAPVAHRIHALETVRQASALVRRAPGPLACLMMVNIADEDSKAGVPAAEALDRAHTLAAVDGIDLVGLMALPPRTTDPEDAAPWFAALQELAARGQEQGLALTELSMGMSQDAHVAVRYGATWVRVGTAIFGVRSR